MKIKICTKKNINEYKTIFGKIFGKELSELLILYTYLKTKKKFSLNIHKRIGILEQKKIYNFENDENLNDLILILKDLKNSELNKALWF